MEAMMEGSASYDSDFYAWAYQQSALLRSGNLAAIDVENIAEEIESMGRSEKRELVNRLVVLLTHLLKWQFQPERRGASWRTIISVQRVAITNHMRDNPSLKSRLPDVITDAYRMVLLVVIGESGLPKETFPGTCPWSFTEIVNETFWPGTP